MQGRALTGPRIQPAELIREMLLQGGRWAFDRVRIGGHQLVAGDAHGEWIKIESGDTRAQACSLHQGSGPAGEAVSDVVSVEHRPVSAKQFPEPVRIGTSWISGCVEDRCTGRIRPQEPRARFGGGGVGQLEAESLSRSRAPSLD